MGNESLTKCTDICTETKARCVANFGVKIGAYIIEADI